MGRELKYIHITYYNNLAEHRLKLELEMAIKRWIKKKPFVKRHRGRKLINLCA
jgi:hypothetical protein